MKQHSGTDTQDDDTPVFAPYQPSFRGPSYLEIIQRVGPALTLPPEQWPCTCLGCCRGANCEREAAEERGEEERSLLATLATERSQGAAAHSQLHQTRITAWRTIRTLLEGHYTLPPKERPARAALYIRDLLPWLAIVEVEDPSIYLADLIFVANTRGDHGGQRRIEDTPGAHNKLRLAEHAQALRRKGWEWKRIVLKLAPDDIDYEGYEEKYGSPGEGNPRAERAANDRMRYLVKRFDEIKRKS